MRIEIWDGTDGRYELRQIRRDGITTILSGVTLGEARQRGIAESHYHGWPLINRTHVGSVSGAPMRTQAFAP